MDILFVTEAWLKPHGDEAKLHDLTPAGYIANSFPPESRGVGIAVVYNKCLSKRIYITYVLFSPPVIQSDATVDNADFWKHLLFLLMHTSTK